MRQSVVQTVARNVVVTGDGVRVGDVISVGGTPHTVCDVRGVQPDRKRLEFEDGNVYVLGRSRPVRVVRMQPARRGGVGRV
ncbi:hypothetical protein AB0L71_16020 [Streptomyces sp. NPDC052052]|uniref:hypothetical protein n=1 Tax=Streptomyces sp. NPDC052052 TaxID=3154756 RepID=UPI003428B100